MDEHSNEHYITLIGNTADHLAQMVGVDRADKAVALAGEIKTLVAEALDRPQPEAPDVGVLETALKEAQDRIAELETTVSDKDGEIMRLNEEAQAAREEA